MVIISIIIYNIKTILESTINKTYKKNTKNKIINTNKNRKYIKLIVYI